jgi:hypothetical protein
MAPLSFALSGGYVRTLRAAVANLPRGIVGPCRFRSEAGRAVRAAVPVLRCLGFSPRQLPPWCRAEHAKSAGLTRAVSSRRLATLCVLRLREPYPTARRLTSSVARRALPRGLLRAFALHDPSFVRPCSEPVEPGPFEDRHPVRGDGSLNPGRLRGVGCSILRSSRALRVCLFGLRASLRTLSPDPATPPPSRECGRLVLPRARSARSLDLAIADVKKMLPHSPLQPT